LNEKNNGKFLFPLIFKKGVKCLSELHREKELLDALRTDVAFDANPLRALRTDVQPKRNSSLYLEQIKNRKKKVAFIPLASGLMSITMGLGLLVQPVFADNGPLMSPDEPSYLPKQQVETPKVDHHHHEQQKQREKKEPVSVVDLGITLPPVVKNDDKPSEPSESDKTAVEQPAQVQEPPRLQPSQEDKPVVAKPAPVSSPAGDVKKTVAQTSVTTTSSKKQEPVHIDNAGSEVVALTATSVQSSTTKANEKIDTTPVQRTEEGGQLPKTAGESMYFILAGALILLGERLIAVYRRMMRHAI
jgi:hypothetical protein